MYAAGQSLKVDLFLSVEVVELKIVLVERYRKIQVQSEEKEVRS